MSPGYFFLTGYITLNELPVPSEIQIPDVEVGPIIYTLGELCDILKSKIICVCKIPGM